MITDSCNSINLQSSDIGAMRLAELYRLLPDIFDGEGRIDEAALREVVRHGQSGEVEQFRFTWAGKQGAKRYGFMPSARTLVVDRARSVNVDTTRNLIIEGDNLEVLKLLQASYFETIKCIYIDPPYNTGRDHLYPDNYSEARRSYQQTNGTLKDGIRLVANTETAGRHHSRWLCMMLPRLLLARQLLREDGTIFISIGDDEQANLKMLCNEVFGQENFVATMIREAVKGGTGPTASIRTTHDYVHVYAKNKALCSLGGTDVQQGPLDQVDEHGPFRKGRELNKWGTGSRREDSPSMWFSIPGPNNEEVYPIRNDGSQGRWRWGKKKMQEAVTANNVLFEPRGDGTFIVYEKIRTEESNKKPYASLLLSDCTNASGTECVKKLFAGKSVMDFPKPVSLIQYICRIADVKDDDIVLDFFAGSGTTAHAVLAENAVDAGSRRFILVQYPECTSDTSLASECGYETISDLCIERVKRAGEQIVSEDNVNGHFDHGFRVCYTGDSFFSENLFVSDPDKSEEENAELLRAHVEQAKQGNLFAGENVDDVIAEVSLKNGYGLFFNVTAIDISGIDNTIYRLSGNGKEMLLCLDPKLESSTAGRLADEFASQQFAVSEHALDTADMWTLRRAFGENLHLI